MQIALLISAMIVGTLVFFRLRLSNASARNRRKWDGVAGLGASNPFHAVSILPDQQSCVAVDSLRQQRFLSDEAPSLPLLDCSAENCGCRYIHHADRRSGARDRRSGLAAQSADSELWGQSDRRLTTGRRLQDQLAI